MISRNTLRIKIVKAIEENEQESLPTGRQAEKVACRKAGVLSLFKKAREKNKRNETYKFWRQDNHPIECSNKDILESRMRYMHVNPVPANIVRNECEYVYSSGIDFFKGGKGLLEISFLLYPVSETLQFIYNS